MTIDVAPPTILQSIESLVYDKEITCAKKKKTTPKQKKEKENVQTVLSIAHNSNVVGHKT